MDSSQLSSTRRPKLELTIRGFNKDTDISQIQELERSCDAEATPHGGKTSLVFTVLNVRDPLCRVRSYPSYRMLVAEARTVPEFGTANTKIVGVIRAGIKDVIGPVEGGEEGGDAVRSPSEYVKVMYISGLRVCCCYRRMGIAQKLVQEIESWGITQGAQYAYLASETDNQPSINLFTHKMGYIKFRSPSILVQPVYGKLKMVKPFSGMQHSRNRGILIFKLGPITAERFYRSAHGRTEFFPMDIDRVLRNPLNFGTWVACYKEDIAQYKSDTGVYSIDLDDEGEWADPGGSPRSEILRAMEEGRFTWAMLSLWRYDKLINFEVRGASAFMKRWASLTRLASKFMPWVVLPCLPNVFDKSFGVQLIYGLHVSRPDGRRSKDPMTLFNNSVDRPGAKTEWRNNSNDADKDRTKSLLQSLCWHAHDMALKAGCKAVMVETGSCDPIKEDIPHWPLLSEHDLWCLKRLCSISPSTGPNHVHDDWCKWPPSASLFPDPRDF
ncbi:hypothetical protein KP509_30G047700 [Ceratopteris richardii]|uniref:N-acetyltransferase domain-containing protein n=1 Tax=Ceratopteris richardii TaxID=49495 RepID=A0A8T2R2A0_CERRI|nr:hypothetical protein KP509_30G047700 [Ceratopteris richardii]